MERVGRRNIRSFMPEHHRSFFAQLPFLIVGSVDRDGWPWASILSGAPGFARSPDPQHLQIAAQPPPGDPLAAALAPGSPLGVLGIELPTRRRNRLNGRIAALDAHGFSMAVEQSFGNCDQYIQRREYLWTGPAPRAVSAEPFTVLDDDARALIGRADTGFVASASRADGPASEDPPVSRGVDVSHRGGRPGFLGIASDGAIVVPDYSGNRFFNTLGNLLVNPRAGLLVPDFATNDLLQITGTTEIVWDGPAVRTFQGAERLWRLMPSHGRWLRRALPLRLEFREPSRNNLTTGTWREAQAALTAA